MNCSNSLSLSVGGMTTFNIQFGFVEAVVRGFRTGFLSDLDYRNLTQCETMDDMKLNLQETDYSEGVVNLSSLTPMELQSAALAKLVSEFHYLRAQAPEPLGTFLDYIAIEYMIENVMLLLRGSLSGRPVEELMAQCHPLGMFKDSVMRSIPSFEPNAEGYSELYETVLIDTPVGPYFQTYLTHLEEQGLGEANDIKGVLEETQIEILKYSLMKLYYEDFLFVCQQMGGDTAEVMSELISARADIAAINITLNSFGTPLNRPNMRETVRKGLYPSVGRLYPAGSAILSKVDDESKLVEALRPFRSYHSVIERLAEDANIDDGFAKQLTKLYELAFEGQMHFGVFYAYFHLKQQEIRNLTWIAECIVQKRKDQIESFVRIFSK